MITYDDRPKRRLYDLLQSQGLRFNQDITFLSDGGGNICDIQFFLNPQAEHLLDWFHITMRITTMRRMAKGLPQVEDSWLTAEDADRYLESAKWYLWHGNGVQVELVAVKQRPPTKHRSPCLKRQHE